MGENSLTYNQNTTLQEIINTMPYSSIPAQSLLKYYARKKYERAPFISTGSDARKGRPMTEQKNKEHYFRIYPNPTERDITISFNEISDGIIQIRSISGSLIKSYNVFSRKEIKLNVSSIVNGLYIVVYLPDDLSETKFSKLIIQR